MNKENPELQSNNFYSFSLSPKSGLRTKLWWQIQIICRNKTGYMEGGRVQAAMISSLNDSELTQLVYVRK
jgi:hypothetical protein